MNAFFRIVLILVTGGFFSGSAILAQIPGAHVSVKVAVPESYQRKPFDRERELKVPEGAKISVLARIEKARFLAVSPEGDVLVSQPSSGKVLFIKQSGPSEHKVYELINGLRLPHGMVFHGVGSKIYLYISQSNRISRFIYSNDSIGRANEEIVVSNLPDRSSPGLGGAYGHELKNIAIGPDEKLYVDIASATNADPADTRSDPVRCAIYQYDLDGKNRKLFATGIRNAEGLAFLPGTDELWAVVNERDDIRYPFDGKRGEHSASDYGRVMRWYVDDHPPDEFIHVKEGANYGWPFANPNPDKGLDHMPFDPDYDTNRNWSRFPENSFTRIDKGIPAHSAPLGFSFLQTTRVPFPYRNGAVVALHGSWDRSRKTGYKIIFFPWLPSGEPGAQVDLVTGWLDDETQRIWGRPVDIVPDMEGNLLISDDYSGTIYKLSLGH
ncbi:MAG: PQQ-dependent sugar dehydrogenase [Verrucomicrobia bacterium]|nr:PQQ-dependent sugar dehydrogenase [Verrucomicrobiota bacterium]